jgi:tRNA(fMet)-specific endonuclease VapC
MTKNRVLLSCCLLLGLSAPAWAQMSLTPRSPSLLIHGNYCGPGNNAPLPPIDALDLACAHHDACTPDGGLPSPACNARLRREADAVAHDPRQPEDLRALAGIVALGAGLMPANPRVASAPALVPGAGEYAPVLHRPDPLPPAPLGLDDEDDED